MVKIFLATPCYGGLCLDKYMISIIKLQLLLINKGVQLMLDTTENESLVHRARNVSVGRFMQKTDAEYFMFIDADVDFDPDSVVKLLESDHDIAVACYPKKVVMWDQAAEAIKNGEKDMKEKMEELREMKKKEGMMKRKAQLEEAGFEAEALEETLAQFEDVDDDTFAKVIATLAIAKPAPKPEKADEHGDKEDKKDAKAEIEEELDAAEASEEVLEEAEASEEVAISEVEPEVDPAESLRSVASEWIGSFLQSNPKNK